MEGGGLVGTTAARSRFRSHCGYLTRGITRNSAAKGAAGLGPSAGASHRALASAQLEDGEGGGRLNN